MIIMCPERTFQSSSFMAKKQNQDHGLLVLTFTDSEACIYHYHALGKLFQVAPHLIGNMDTIMAQLPASPPDRLLWDGSTQLAEVNR